ncbi:recombinase RecT [Paenibacillus sp. FJAT-26967]|uniref:recombinase RecT n=1 Tax=Paenibacillus sp. FJAT-26967 TaxID=1729690 RepID=UPI000A03F172|nr:recombinase RecT [Paenibacillus sp. FJAT-26967]
MSKQVDQSDISKQLATKVNNPPAEKSKTVFDLIKSMGDGFKRALPEHIGHERFVRIALTIVKTNPKLMKCDAMSIIAALMQSAQLGLEPNTPTKEAHLIPRSNKRIVDGKEIWVDEAQFQIGYRGLVKLVWQSGIVSEIDCDMICEGDKIVYEKGKDGTFNHIPLIDGERGEPYAYYAYAVTKDGGFVCTVMSKKEIIKHAHKFTKSKDKKSGELYGPWKDDFDSMALKTVLIALSDKKLPKSSALQQMIAQDGTIKREVSDDMSEVVDVTDYTVVLEDGEGDVPAESGSETKA